LLGDLNVTPWSPYFQELLAATGLRDSARGWGLQPSWPTMSLLLRVPIDHCLISPELHVTERTLGPDIGSDHFPLLVTLAVQRPSASQ
jgi:endonuclease/exonuclease/phosphatase (EEP) superfamily protein YafD